VNRPAPDLREVWEEAPDEVAEVLCRALDRDPAVRPRSAPELVTELEGALAGKAAAAPAPTVTMPIPGPAETEPATPATDESPSTPTAEEPPTPPPPPPRQPTPTPTPGPSPMAPPKRRSHARALAAIAALAIAALLGVLLLTGDVSEPGEAGGAGQSGQERAGGGASAPGDPAAAVQDFYELAAADDYSGAWQLASPSFRSELGGFAAFRDQQSTLESIRFTSLDTTSQSAESAEVSFSTIASHTDYTDVCTGQMTMVNDDGWLLDDPIAIECETNPD
jgi:hypothetical protein